MLNHRDRVLKAIAHEPVDRVPVDYWGRTDFTNRLIAHLGLQTREELYQKLGIDMRHISISEHHPEYDKRTNGVLGGHIEGHSGKRFIFHSEGVYEDAWGIVRSIGSNQLYEQWVTGPFADSVDLNKFVWPNLDIFDSIDVICKKIEVYSGKYVLQGRINLPFKVAWHMRGLENFLCDMLCNRSFAGELLERVSSYEIEKAMRLISAGVDIIGIYGDIATQDRMLVTPQSWRELEKPLLAKMIKMFRAKKPDIKMFFHSDGNITEVFPDLIEIGFDIINPIQPESMDPAEVKRQFGEQITMHGTISVQKTLPKGTMSDVIDEVQTRIKTCGDNGGLIICPSNLIQNDTSFENVIAMYQAAVSISSLK